LTSATRSGSVWKLTLEQGGSFIETTCSFLVLSGGRSGSILPCLGARRRRIDKLICLGMWIDGYDGDQRPAVEAYQNGWVYSVGLPSGRLMINLFTESDRRHGRHIDNSVEFLLREISNCPIVQSRTLASHPRNKEDVVLFVADASSAYVRPVAGPGWRLAGDQAQSMDPLSSHGIMQALEHAQMVSQTFAETQTPRQLDIDEYGSSLDKSYRNYLASRQQIYGLEQRWRTPFWLRRSDMHIEGGGWKETSSVTQEAPAAASRLPF
jgi:hypothetical protein